jgi:hypothetical protein
MCAYRAIKIKLDYVNVNVKAAAAAGCLGVNFEKKIA